MPRADVLARRAKARPMLMAAHVAQKKYVKSLRGILGQLHKEFISALGPVGGWHEDAGHSAWKKVIDRLHGSIENLRAPAGKAFDLMAAAVNKKNHEAAKDLLGLTPSQTRVSEQIATIRQENIDLVVKAGRDYADDVQDIFDDPDNLGLSPDALKDLLLERGDVSESRAELIARDQTLKLNGALNQTRQENAGVAQYIWSTSKDERVRPSHAAMEGQTCDWDDPPDIDGEALHPGEDFQCRCIAIPVMQDLTTENTDEAPEDSPEDTDQ